METKIQWQKWKKPWNLFHSLKTSKWRPKPVFLVMEIEYFIYSLTIILFVLQISTCSKNRILNGHRRFFFPVVAELIPKKTEFFLVELVVSYVARWRLAVVRDGFFFFDVSHHYPAHMELAGTATWLPPSISVVWAKKKRKEKKRIEKKKTVPALLRIMMMDHLRRLLTALRRRSRWYRDLADQTVGGWRVTAERTSPITRPIHFLPDEWLRTNATVGSEYQSV